MSILSRLHRVETSFTMASTPTRSTDRLIARAVMQAAARAAQHAADVYADAHMVDDDDDDYADDDDEYAYADRYGHYSTDDYRLLGTMAIPAYVSKIQNGDILRSGYYGRSAYYFAAFLETDGRITAMTQHAAYNNDEVCNYAPCFNAGRVRLCVEFDYVSVQCGHKGSTSAQRAAVVTLASLLGVDRIGVSLENLPTVYRSDAADAARHLAKADADPPATPPTPPATPTPPARPTPYRYRSYAARSAYLPRHITARPNRYAGCCADCGSSVPAGAGTLTRHGGRWVVRCTTC